MTGFTLAAATYIAARLLIGAAATVGVTLAVQDHSAQTSCRRDYARRRDC
jgi:hypothetical protein